MISAVFFPLMLFCGLQAAVASVPEITAIAPFYMVRGGSGQVDIYGSNIDASSTVAFSNPDVVITAQDYDPSLQRIGVDVTVSGAAALGAVQVTVSNTAGSATADNMFYVASSTSEDISANAPNRGYVRASQMPAAVARSAGAFTGFPSLLVLLRKPSSFASSVDRLTSTTFDRLISSSQMVSLLDIAPTAETGAREIAVYDNGEILFGGSFTIEPVPSSGDHIPVIPRHGKWDGIRPNSVQFDLPFPVDQAMIHVAGPAGMIMTIRTGPLPQGYNTIGLRSSVDTGQRIPYGIYPGFLQATGTQGTVKGRFRIAVAGDNL